MKNGKIFILKQLSSKASLKDKILIYIIIHTEFIRKGQKVVLTGIYRY